MSVPIRDDKVIWRTEAYTLLYEYTDAAGDPVDLATTYTEVRYLVGRPGVEESFRKDSGGTGGVTFPQVGQVQIEIASADTQLPASREYVHELWGDDELLMRGGWKLEDSVKGSG